MSWATEAEIWGRHVDTLASAGKQETQEYEIAVQQYLTCTEMMLRQPIRQPTKAERSREVEREAAKRAQRDHEEREMLERRRAITRPERPAAIPVLKDGEPHRLNPDIPRPLLTASSKEWQRYRDTLALRGFEDTLAYQVAKYRTVIAKRREAGEYVPPDPAVPKAPSRWHDGPDSVPHPFQGGGKVPAYHRWKGEEREEGCSYFFHEGRTAY